MHQSLRSATIKLVKIVPRYRFVQPFAIIIHPHLIFSFANRSVSFDVDKDEVADVQVATITISFGYAAGWQTSHCFRVDEMSLVLLFLIGKSVI